MTFLSFKKDLRGRAVVQQWVKSKTIRKIRIKDE